MPRDIETKEIARFIVSQTAIGHGGVQTGQKYLTELYARSLLNERLEL